MTLAVEFMLKRTKLLGKPYMECSEDPESNHCYQLEVFIGNSLTKLSHYETLKKKLIEDRIRKSCKCNYGKIHNEGSNKEEIDGHHNIGDLRYFWPKILEIFTVKYH